MEQPEKINSGLEKTKISPEKIEQYMQEIDAVLKIEVIVALQGYQVERDTYEPWPLEEMKKNRDSIITFFNQKILLFKRAGMQEEAEEAQKRSDVVKEALSELDTANEVPDGFLQKLKDVVETNL